MTEARPSIADKRRTFRQMHEAGCFVIPNPWDLGSARFSAKSRLQGAGDDEFRPRLVARPARWRPRRSAGVLAHLHDTRRRLPYLPVNADFESGFAGDAAGVAHNVRLALESGVAGVSIEDSTGDPAQPLHDPGTAVDRIRAARKAIDAAGGDTVLVGRAECFRSAGRISMRPSAG